MKKKSMVFLVTLAMLAGTISGCGSSKTTTEVKAGDNQKLVYAMVTAIEGNEMTYREVDQSMISRLTGTNRTGKNSSGSQSGSSSQKKGDGQSQWSGNSQKSQGSGNAQQWQGGESGNSQKSQGSGDAQQWQGSSSNTKQSKTDTTEMPSMNKESSSGNTSEKTKGSTGTSSSKSSGTNSSMMSGTTTTVQIPVGVTVHTASNTNTTFSRIRSGDILELLMQKDDDGKEVIVGIWMLK